MKPSRRAMFGLGTLGLFLPRVIRASSPTDGRNFIFIHCPGGWDQAIVFAPIFNESVDRFDGDELAEANGVSFVNSVTRPNVAAFFTDWGSRVCLINGMQVPSVAHDVCTRWVLTGDSLGTTDDWASIIAGHGSSDLMLPNLHVSGPLFPRVYGSATVRLGLEGQLSALLSGDSFPRSTVPVVAPSAAREVLEEAALSSRLERWASTQPLGMTERLATAERLAQRRAAGLVEHIDILTRGQGTDLDASLAIVAGCLSEGLSRTAMLAFGLGGNGQWDTHSVNYHQLALFEELFAGLSTLCASLEALPGKSGGTLLDDTTIVVLSEMGRTPSLNGAEGKDHWTWTSAMLIGSGVRGGSVVGQWTEELTGEAVDLESGLMSDSGETLMPAHLGATLLELADVDPAEFISEADGTPIRAAIS